VRVKWTRAGRRIIEARPVLARLRTKRRAALRKAASARCAGGERGAWRRVEERARWRTGDAREGCGLDERGGGEGCGRSAEREEEGIVRRGAEARGEVVEQVQGEGAGGVGRVLREKRSELEVRQQGDEEEQAAAAGPGAFRGAREEGGREEEARGSGGAGGLGERGVRGAREGRRQRRGLRAEARGSS
jgi:hypothetical protein